MLSARIKVVLLIASILGICLFIRRDLGDRAEESFSEEQSGEIFLYDKEQPLLYVRPCSAEGSDGSKLFFFLPYSDRNWVWHVPDGLSVYIDGVPYASGEALGSPDTETDHVYAVEADGVFIDVRQLAFLQAEHVAALSMSLPSSDIDTIISEDYPESVEAASLYITDEEGKADSRVSCEITGHGNSTWLSSKKSFGIKTISDISPLGMEYGSKWDLIANNMDRSHIKNRIVYEAAGRTGLEFSVDCEYLNLYINGIYQGLYLLTQKPFASGGAVSFPDELQKENILLNGSLPEYPQITKDAGTKEEIKFNDISLSPGDISGSYMMEFREFDEELMPHIRDNLFYSYISTDRSGNNYVLQVRYPKVITEEEIRYIRDYVWTTESAVYSPNGVDVSTGTCYRDRIDLYSWAMSALFMDFFAYQDESAGSLFFYKKRGKPLLYSGPIWDYDKAMTDDFVKTDDFPPDGRINIYLWYRELERFDDFRECVVSNYNDELSPIMDEILSVDLPLWTAQIASSEKMDDIRWMRGESYGEEHTRQVADWIRIRKEYFDDLLRLRQSGDV